VNAVVTRGLLAVFVAFAFLGILGYGAGYWLGYFPNRIRDITFDSIKPIDRHDFNDVPNRFAYDLVRLHMLHLRFASNSNLRKVAEDSGSFGAWVNVSRCPFDHDLQISIARVLHNGIDLDTKPVRSCVWTREGFQRCDTLDDTPQVRAEMLSTKNTKGPFFYDAYLTYYDQQRFDPSKHTSVSFPLPKTLGDLCFQVHGDGGAPGFLSNVARVPVAALTPALAELTKEMAVPKSDLWQPDPSPWR